MSIIKKVTKLREQHPIWNLSPNLPFILFLHFYISHFVLLSFISEKLCMRSFMAENLLGSIFQVVQRFFGFSCTGVFITKEFVEDIVGLLDMFYTFLWIS